MQTASTGGNLHETSKPISGNNKENIVTLSSAESAHSILSVKVLSEIIADHSLIFLKYFFCENDLTFHINHLLGR